MKLTTTMVHKWYARMSPGMGSRAVGLRLKLAPSLKNPYPTESNMLHGPDTWWQPALTSTYHYRHVSWCFMVTFSSDCKMRHRGIWVEGHPLGEVPSRRTRLTKCRTIRSWYGQWPCLGGPNKSILLLSSNFGKYVQIHHSNKMSV